MTLAQPLRTVQTDRGALLVFADAPTLGIAAAQRFAHLAQQAAHRHEPFTVALSGGSTPGHFYSALAAEPLVTQVPWTTCEFFWGDERAVGPDDPDSNYGMAKRELFDKLPPAPAPQPGAIVRMEGEADDLDAAAVDYERQLRDHLEADEVGNAVFDLVVLGLGDDGHTASLFPGTEAPLEGDRLVVANNVPQLDTNRLTLTYRAINAAREVWFLVSGDAKTAVLRDILLRGTGYPASSVHPATPPLWFADTPAARLVE